MVQRSGELGYGPARVGLSHRRHGGAQRWPTRGEPHTYEARYFDIVPNRRIIYAYDMYVGARKLSVSLASIELTPQGRRTHLALTEQGAYLDGVENGSERRAGTELLMNRLAATL